MYGGDFLPKTLQTHKPYKFQRSKHCRLFFFFFTETVCVCASSYLHSLDLRGLDNRRLRGLDDTVDLDRLPVGELHQRYRWPCGWGVACRHRYLEPEVTHPVTLRHKLFSFILTDANVVFSDMHKTAFSICSVSGDSHRLLPVPKWRSVPGWSADSPSHSQQSPPPAEPLLLTPSSFAEERMEI